MSPFGTKLPFLDAGQRSLKGSMLTDAVQHTRDGLEVVIFLVAIDSIPLFLFGLPTELDIKTYGFIAFGLILVFGAINIVLV